MGSWKFFLILLIVCLVVQGFFAMLEMATVSFNKVRLQYYVSKNNKRAIWLSRLLNAPGKLFATCLICINTALQVGSECSRHLYDSLGLSSGLAPLTQVFIVLIFAEIAPLFAGRRYAESAAMLGAPILYAASKILSPFIWLLDGLCRLICRLMGRQQSSGFYLSREELQKILEQRDEEEFKSKEASERLNTVVSNIFSLKNKTARELMKPLSSVQLVPSFCTVAEMRSLLTAHYSPFVPIYHKTIENIVAVAYPRDLLRQAENKRIREYARPPWFITEKDSILMILKQFRRNSQSVAIVLNEAGLGVGILTLDEIVDEIFEQEDKWNSLEEALPKGHRMVLDRSFPGGMRISDFNRAYGADLEDAGDQTLAGLITQVLGHPPTVGESIRQGRFELVVEEASLLEAKVVGIKTVF